MAVGRMRVISGSEFVIAVVEAEAEAEAEVEAEVESEAEMITSAFHVFGFRVSDAVDESFGCAISTTRNSTVLKPSKRCARRNIWMTKMRVL